MATVEITDPYPELREKVVGTFRMRLEFTDYKTNRTWYHDQEITLMEDTDRKTLAERITEIVSDLISPEENQP